MNVDRPRSDRVLYLGMNEDSADVEANALRSHGASVKQLRPHDGGTVAMDGNAYDLANDEGIHAFCKDLAIKHGMGPEHEDALVRAFRSCDTTGRDELAQIAMEWAPAEEGHAIPSRLVVSGHHGEVFFGREGRDSVLRDDAVRALADALPSAARQIEDIHFSGCNTQGSVQDFPEWRSSFPNLKTMWGYAGTAPLAPAAHLVEWERATRGRGDFFSKAGLQNHHNAIAWSSRGGLAGAETSPAEVRAACGRADARYPNWVAGQGYDTSTAAEDYTAYRNLAGMRESTSTERAEASAHAAVMLRVRYYDHGVRAGFAATHGATITRAYEQLGLHAPDFSKLTRAQALAEIHSFFERAGGVRPRSAEVEDALKALHGLATLDSSTISETWCH